MFAQPSLNLRDSELTIPSHSLKRIKSLLKVS